MFMFFIISIPFYIWMIYQCHLSSWPSQGKMFNRWSHLIANRFALSIVLVVFVDHCCEPDQIDVSNFESILNSNSSLFDLIRSMTYCNISIHMYTYGLLEIERINYIYREECNVCVCVCVWKKEQIKYLPTNVLQYDDDDEQHECLNLSRPITTDPIRKTPSFAFFAG